MSDLSGKVALVTGASGGIGMATARLLHERGARLVLSDLADEGPVELMAELGKDAVWCRCDVTQEADNAAMVRIALDTFGTLDIAVLNAGIEGRAGAIGETSLENFDRVMAVNVRGVFAGLSQVMPVMKRAGSGVVTIISSTAGRRGTANLSPYITSKHAVVGLMKCAALEGAPHGVRVNTVNPGPIATRMMEQLEREFSPDSPQAAHEQLLGLIPAGRYGTAEEVAEMIAFLSSGRASYCSGNIYGVDGAYTAG